MTKEHPGTAYNTPGLGKDEQPDNYANLYRGSYDNGGVHINSGIPNRAFYLSAVAIGGYAYDDAGKIWYNVLTNRQLGLQRDTDIPTFAKLTITSANDLYDSITAQLVRQAWITVGVPV